MNQDTVECSSDRRGCFPGMMRYELKKKKTRPASVSRWSPRCMYCFGAQECYNLPTCAQSLQQICHCLIMIKMLQVSLYINFSCLFYVLNRSLSNFKFILFKKCF